MDPTPITTRGARPRARLERALRAFVDAFPANARVSEPALPLVLATLHATLDARARLPARRGRGGARRRRGESAGSSTPPTVALLPSRGVRAGSGLEPPAHLVGERARALDVLRDGGLVCASARALAEGMPPPDERTAVVRLTRAGTRDLDALVEELALAGYERVERVEERGQIAVRGGLVDVFPSTGREPLRVEFFGDDIEQIRAFSPFTQRALHPVADASIYPARERVARQSATERAPRPSAYPLLPGPARPRLADRRRREPLGGGRSSSLRASTGAARLDALPRSQPHVFEAQRPAIAARGLAEAENELAGMVRQGRRVVVTFPHQGEALRTQRAAAEGRGGASTDQVDELASDPSARIRRQPGAARLRLARPRARAPPGHAGLPQAAAAGRRAARSRAPVVRRPSGRRLRRPRGSRRRQAPRLRDEGRRRRHARLPLPRLPRRGPPLRPARADREGLPLHRRRREGAGAVQARREGVAEPQEPRARLGARARRRAPLAVRPPAGRRPARRSTSRTTGSSGSRARSRTARPRISSRRSRR